MALGSTALSFRDAGMAKREKRTRRSSSASPERPFRALPIFCCDAPGSHSLWRTSMRRTRLLRALARADGSPHDSGNVSSPWQHLLRRRLLWREAFNHWARRHRSDGYLAPADKPMNSESGAHCNLLGLIQLPVSVSWDRNRVRVAESLHSQLDVCSLTVRLSVSDVCRRSITTDRQITMELIDRLDR